MCETIENKRDYTYDWVRIIAIFLVVLGHSAYLSMSSTSGGVDYQLPSDINPIYYTFIFDFSRKAANWVYGFHMPLFFMLSGAIFSLKPIIIFEKVFEAKIKRLVIPFFIYGVCIMLPLKWFAGFYDSFSIRQAFSNFLTGNGDTGHLWFLQALFWCFVVFAVVIIFSSRYGLGKYGPLFISLIIYMLVPLMSIDFWAFKLGMQNIVFFVLGYYFELFKMKERLSKEIKLLLAAICIIVEIIHFKYWILNVFFMNMVGALLTILVADICAHIFHGFDSTKVFDILLRNCFYIYLIHDPINYIVLKIFFTYDFLKYKWGCIVYLLSRTILLICVCVLIGEIIRLFENILAYKKIIKN